MNATEPRTPATSPRWPGERCGIIKSVWDDKLGIGTWTFECKQGHRWREEARHTDTRGPLKGKVITAFQFKFFTRYWRKENSGVNTYCPVCDKAFYKARRKGLKTHILAEGEAP